VVRYSPPYFVHVNWTHRYAMVHYGDCPHSNYGGGTQSNVSGENTEWLGPFGTLGEANHAAYATGQEVSCCGVCQPT